MRVAAELHGGIFDGDAGALEIPAGHQLPPVLWAAACCDTDCQAGGIHWLEEPLANAPKYVFDHMSETRPAAAVYYHADLDYDDILGHSETGEA